jgi:hypothetical protein
MTRRLPDAAGTRSFTKTGCSAAQTQCAPTYLEEWERESKASQNWQRVPSKTMDVVAAQTVEELRDVERALAHVTTEVSGLVFRVASSRETGRPPGYVHGR